MLKVVVFDSGYGGEIFADKLEEELPIIKVIRVIDWRNAEIFLKNPKLARRQAAEALRPYIKRVDLIILANYLLTVTSLKYFKRKYKDQKFCGLKLPCLSDSFGRPTVALTTKALAKTLNYHNYLFRLKRKVDTLCLDEWPALIDDGELNVVDIQMKFEEFFLKHHYKPSEIIIACGQFRDIVPELRNVISNNIKIHDGFDETIRDACKMLKIRGGIGKKRE